MSRRYGSPGRDACAARVQRVWRRFVRRRRSLAWCLSSLSLDVGPSVRQVTVSVGHEDDFEDVATVTFEGGGNKRVPLDNVLARDVRIRIDRASGSFAIVQKVEVVGVPA